MKAIDAHNRMLDGTRRFAWVRWGSSDDLVRYAYHEQQADGSTFMAGWVDPCQGCPCPKGMWLATVCRQGGTGVDRVLQSEDEAMSWVEAMLEVLDTPVILRERLP